MVITSTLHASEDPAEYLQESLKSLPKTPSRLHHRLLDVDNLKEAMFCLDFPFMCQSKKIKYRAVSFLE